MILFIAFNIFAASESTNTFEKTYPRDNTFCSYKKSRIEISIRGSNKFTEPKEKGYGEFIFLRKTGFKPSLLPLNESRSDTFRFFTGKSSVCSKSHGYLLNESTMAILFLKENQPFKDKLAFQIFDHKTLTAIKHVETDYPTDKAKKIDHGFAFRTLPEILNPDMGKVQIGPDTFIFQEKSFPLWINYTEKGFEVSADETYSQFPYKKLFKSKEDFMTSLGWDESEMKFKKSIIYYAINHKLKKECFLFVEAKTKFTGSESWICQDIKAE